MSEYPISPEMEAWLEANRPTKPPTEAQIAVVVRAVLDARRAAEAVAS